MIELMLTDKQIWHCRLDGDTDIKHRMGIINEFNSTTQEGGKLMVFLLTTRVGSLGINLTSANKVLIFDPDWNPMVDIQATERALRIGQTRDVSIFRFVSEETIEEKIYHRQIFKKFMADRILADPTRRKLFEKENLYNLLTVPSYSSKPQLKIKLEETQSAFNNKDTNDSDDESPEKEHDTGAVMKVT